MAARKFRPNRNVVAELQRQPQHREMLRAKADLVKDAAEHQSPIGETGDYIHGFVVTLPAGSRAVRARVGNTDFAAHLIEWGSVNNPPYAPLRRGVRAAGLRLKEE